MSAKPQVVLADPPWPFRAWRGGSSRTADSHYQRMTMDEILSFEPRTAWRRAENAVLFLWTPCSFLEECLPVFPAWGFRFKTVAFVWVKLTVPVTTRERGPVFYEGGHHKLHFGMGHYTRQQAELVLVGTRGPVRPQCRSVPQVVLAPVGEHSEKPVEVHRRIETLYPTARRLELFARKRRRGWTCRGDEL